MSNKDNKVQERDDVTKQRPVTWSHIKLEHMNDKFAAAMKAAKQQTEQSNKNK
jgi:hypothetical protein